MNDCRQHGPPQSSHHRRDHRDVEELHCSKRTRPRILLQPVGRKEPPRSAPQTTNALIRSLHPPSSPSDKPKASGMAGHSSQLGPAVAIVTATSDRSSLSQTFRKPGPVCRQSGMKSALQRRAFLRASASADRASQRHHGNEPSCF